MAYWFLCMCFGQQVNGYLFKEIPSQQKLFSLSDSPHKLESQHFSIQPVYTEKEVKLRKKGKEKQWNPWRFSHYCEWQQSQLGWVLFNIQCPKQMVRRSIQRCDFVMQVKLNGSVGAIDWYLERKINLLVCIAS